MPLYQGLGNDGFFLASEVQPFWLFVSMLLRRARLAVMLQLLPGISRHRARADSLVVDTRIARWFPLEVFHLFGFRKLRWNGPILIVTRRPYDLAPPGRSWPSFRESSGGNGRISSRKSRPKPIGEWTCGGGRFGSSRTGPHVHRAAEPACRRVSVQWISS